MSALTYRHEWKHWINAADAMSLLSRLPVVMRRDPHAGPSGIYRIRSLYFDNADDKALREKLDGMPVREKFRLRYYNNDDSIIHLEKKCKVRSLTHKESTRISRSECEGIIAGDTSWMMQSGRPLIVELYAKMQTEQLRPVTIVDYAREAFIYEPGNVRVTLDSDIRSGMQGTQMFDHSLPTLAVDFAPDAILEVKYDSFLPGVIADIIQLRDRQTSVFSKYAACRVFG